jgi:hypothetical protein
MRNLLTAGVLSALLLGSAGTCAFAAGQQSTGAQSDLRQSVKAKHPTFKRHQIIRSEENKNTTGSGPMR